MTSSRTFFMIPLALFAGCAYNPPAALTPEARTQIVSAPLDTVWPRAIQALTTRGMPIARADRAEGLLTTSPQMVRLTESDADCGNIWGIPYLKDNRTTTEVAYSVLLQGDGASTRVTVVTAIRGVFNSHASESTKRLTCVSLGTLETRLIDSIRNP